MSARWITMWAVLATAALAAGCGDALVGGDCGEGYVEEEGECVEARGAALDGDAGLPDCDGGPCGCALPDAGGAGDAGDSDGG